MSISGSVMPNLLLPFEVKDYKQSFVGSYNQ